MTEENLKPCPFCGSTETGYGMCAKNPDFTYIFCYGCRASGPDTDGDYSDAITKWNTRHKGQA